MLHAPRIWTCARERVTTAARGATLGEMIDRGVARSASWVLEGAVSAVALASGGGAPVFACAQGAECRDGVGVGVCQGEGVCSFPDPTCDSGQRFGAHGGAFAGQCVPV